MVRKAFLRANIPFTVSNIINFNDSVLKKFVQKGWNRIDIQGTFLLKHINTSFEKNVVCFSKQMRNATFDVPFSDSCDSTKSINYSINITEAYIYYFDTGVGIISFHIPYDSGTSEDCIANICSILRCSAKNVDTRTSRTIIRNGSEIYLSCLAEEELSTLHGSDFSLFSHFSEISSRRIDMFSAVLCDLDSSENISKSCDRLCYLLANALDNRDAKLALPEEEFYRQHGYTRWSFSKRGCSAVANFNGIHATDSFLENTWFSSVKSNYFHLYLMVLHQKYAIYNYLNIVASDTEKNKVKINQELLIEFNSKYIFAIVSDEQFIQNAYLRIKETNNVNEVYSDLLDELQRLFEYSRLKSDENNERRNSRLNFVSVVISIFCSLSVVYDTVDFLASRHFTLSGFMITVGFIALTIICTLIPFIIKRNKKKSK